MKFGEGTLYSYPLVVTLTGLVEPKCGCRSESWLAEMSHCPDGSNAKWRGVSPCVCCIAAREHTRRIGIMQHTKRCYTVIVRFEQSTKSPGLCTVIRPHVFFERGQAPGMVEIF